jgi:hypothetical protein
MIDENAAACPRRDMSRAAAVGFDAATRNSDCTNERFCNDPETAEFRLFLRCEKVLQN